MINMLSTTTQQHKDKADGLYSTLHFPSHPHERANRSRIRYWCALDIHINLTAAGHYHVKNVGTVEPVASVRVCKSAKHLGPSCTTRMQQASCSGVPHSIRTSSNICETGSKHPQLYCMCQPICSCCHFQKSSHVCCLFQPVPSMVAEKYGLNKAMLVLNGAMHNMLDDLLRSSFAQTGISGCHVPDCLPTQAFFLQLCLCC